MPRFGPDPRTFFDSVYQASAPWDIADAQPALTRLFTEYPPESPVLDVGCGSGDLAIWLARHGLTVIGVDFAATAVAQANAKRDALEPDVARRVTFALGDALRPSERGQQFGAVVDSGFLHLFDHAERDRFAVELAKTLRHGGRYYVLAFATTFDVPNTPLQVDEGELRARFSLDRGWRVLSCVPAEFHSRIGPVPAMCACIERVAAR
jgi:ubiquinone/menaquinone biosynthesis C-methylase UbiE